LWEHFLTWYLLRTSAILCHAHKVYRIPTYASLSVSASWEEFSVILLRITLLLVRRLAGVLGITLDRLTMNGMLRIRIGICRRLKYKTTG
jgi:hypothetical protein